MHNGEKNKRRWFHENENGYKINGKVLKWPRA